MSLTEIDSYVRTISGKGSLTIPTRFLKAVQIYLYVDVVRENRSVYRSYAVNPPESFYGRITANIGNYVLGEYSIRQERQVFKIFEGSDSQLMRAVKCLEKAVRNYVLLGTGNPAVVFLDQLEEFEPVRWDVDNFKFVCYGGTALRLELKGYEPSDCGIDDSEPTPPPPPPQPEPFPKTPPDEPIDVSPPEPEEPDETDPFPGDDDTPPPEGGNECDAYTVVFRVVYPDYPDGRVFEYNVFGVFEGVEVVPASSGDIGFSDGIMTSGGIVEGDVCAQGSTLQIFGNYPNPVTIIIDSFEPMG